MTYTLTKSLDTMTDSIGRRLPLKEIKRNAYFSGAFFGNMAIWFPENVNAGPSASVAIMGVSFLAAVSCSSDIENIEYTHPISYAGGAVTFVAAAFLAATAVDSLEKTNHTVHDMPHQIQLQGDCSKAKIIHKDNKVTFILPKGCDL